DLRVDRVVVDDVVAVRAAGTRLEERRGVEVTDAEACEVGTQLDRVGEGEVLVQLDAVSRIRHARRPMAREAALGHRLHGGDDARVARPYFEPGRQLVAA